MVHSALKGCRIAVIGNISNAQPQQIKGWVEHAGGKMSVTIDEQTTHVIVSDKFWKARGKLVGQLLERKANGHDIHIMKYHWLERCCQEKRRFHENKREYSWEREEQDKKSGKTTKSGDPRSTAGLMSQVFQESTDAFVDRREEERIEARLRAEATAQKKLEETRYKDWVNQRNANRRNEVAAVFRNGAKRAKKELMSENHHIYTDSTGFSYDVTITKVDTRKNRNERYTLTIYESNSLDFPTYAFNAQFAGTGKTPTNNVMPAVGANFATAMNCFKKTFKEKTLVDWDDRITAAVERSKQGARARGQGTGSPTGERRGMPVDESEIRREEVPFESAPFLYHPPKYGPKGLLPGSVRSPQGSGDDELVGGAVAQQHGGDEYMMSGGNGEREEPGRLSDADYARLMEELNRSGNDLGNEVYDEPHSFGVEREEEQTQIQVDDSMLQEQQPEAAREAQQFFEQLNASHEHGSNEHVQSYLEGQTPLDTDYFDHTQMAEHEQGPLMGFVESEKKRKRSFEDEDEGEFEDDFAVKKASARGNDLGDIHGAYDVHQSQSQYPFDNADIPGGDSMPRGLGEQTQNQREPENWEVDLGLGLEGSRTV